MYYTYRRSGTLWEGRYRATVVDSEQYLLTLMRYIEMNPVRAGMAVYPVDYPWSSYHHNAHGDAGVNSDWLVGHDEYLRLGFDAIERQMAYRALFHSASVTDADSLVAIRDCTHKGWALGSEKFRTQIKKLGKRQAASKGVGRPRKQVE